MKKIGVCFIALFVLVSFVYFTTNEENNEVDTTFLDRQENEISRDIPTSGVPTLVTEKPLSLSPSTSAKTISYKATIDSTLMKEDAKLGSVSNSLKFELSREGVAPFKGAIYDVVINSEITDGTGAEIPDYLGFTFNYENGAFSKVYLQGLNSEHPLNIINTLLQQFSYYQDKHTISLPDGDYSYRYKIDGDKVTRQVLDVVSSDMYEVVNGDATWALTTNAGFPWALEYNTSKTIESNGNTLTFKQKIVIETVLNNKNILALAKYGENVNADYKIAINARQTETIIISSDVDFMETLKAFDANPDLDTAIALGIYASQQGLGFVKDLLSSDEVTDDMRSRIIFALERSGLPEGEYILAGLIEDNSVDETDRIRAMLSISKMGEVSSDLAMNTLENLLTNNNEILARTAMLSIGILGKQNEQIEHRVTKFLAEKLADKKGGYAELVAAGNLGSRELDADVAPYLTSKRADEREMAVRLLARSSEMRPQLMQQMLSDPNTNVVRAIVTGLIDTQGAALTESYQTKLRRKIESSDVSAPTRDLLFEFLLSKSDQPGLNVSLAQRLITFPDVPESTIKRAQKYIDSHK